MAQAPRRACGLTSPGETNQDLVCGRKGVNSWVGIVLGAGIALMTAGPAQGLPVSYRTIDGTGNNLNHASWGSAGVRYRRESSGSHYEDGITAPNGQSRPSPREISNLIVAQGDIEIESSRNLSTALYEFGQFLDHDIGLAAPGSVEAFDILVPAGDPFFDPENTGAQLIPFKR